MRVYTIWPAAKSGKPGGSWRQLGRWLVLDVTAGVDAAHVCAGPMPRSEALAEEMRLRRAQGKA